MSTSDATEYLSANTGLDDKTQRSYMGYLTSIFPNSTGHEPTNAIGRSPGSTGANYTNRGHKSRGSVSWFRG